MKKLLFLLLLIAGLSVNAESYNPSTEAKLEYNQGVDYYKAGQYDRSMASFRRVIKLDPNYIDAYFNLGSILEYLNQNDAALDVFKQIIVRKPDDYESVYKAANISFKLGQIDNAKKYLSLIPSNSDIYSKAQILARSMNTDMQTIKSDVSKTKIEETVSNNQNTMYNNLPSPTGIAGDSKGNVYVACFSDNMIYKITPDGKQMIYIKDNKINGPIAMVSDQFDNLYVSNYNSDNVIKITPSGNISVVISNIQKPYGINITNGMLYISSQGGNSVLKYKI